MAKQWHEMTHYEHWLEMVDNWTYRVVGCSIHDLPDCELRIWHDEGLSPLDTAREALKAAGLTADHPLFQEED